MADMFEGPTLTELSSYFVFGVSLVYELGKAEFDRGFLLKQKLDQIMCYKLINLTKFKGISHSCNLSLEA